MRRIIAVIEVNDNIPAKENLGTIDYLEREFGWLEESGIFLQEAKILDEDDEYDSEDLELVGRIFYKF